MAHVDRSDAGRPSNPDLPARRDAAPSAAARQTGAANRPPTEALTDRTSASVEPERAAGTDDVAAASRVAALAARLLDAPAACVTLRSADSEATLIRSVVGSDGTTHEAWSDVPSSPSEGVSLVTSGGRDVGRLEIVLQASRTLTSNERAILADFGQIVVDEVELRNAVRRPSAEIGDADDADADDARDVAAVATAVRALSADEDPVSMRRAICQIALQLTGADAASVLDLVGEDLRLVQSAVAGRGWELPRLLLDDDGSPAAAAYRAGRPELLDRSRGSPRSGLRWLGGWPTVTYWQPLAAGGRSSAAVLALGWEGPLTLTRRRLARLAELVSAEGTVILERVDLLAQLAGLARTDELTGLPNRRAVHEDLTREMHRAKRDQTQLCVALLDLDFFKAFNDTRGHPAGDRLLAEAAAAWRETLRAGSDTIGRYGGEEFLVVVPAAPDIALATVERLRAATPEGQTVSAGLAAWDGTESASALVGRADVALYRAKAHGRDQTLVARPGDTPSAMERAPVGVFDRGRRRAGSAEERSSARVDGVRHDVAD